MKFLAFALALAYASVAARAAAPAQTLSDSPFANACADTVIESLDGKTWLLTDGFADALLVARAKARGIDLVAMPLLGGADSVVTAYEAAAATLGDPRLEAAASLGAAPFVLTWMQQRPDEAAAKLALMVEPSLAKASGLEPVPGGLVYHLHKPDAVTSNVLLRAYAHHAALRDAIGETIALAPADAASTAGAKWFRARASACGNNLGVLLHSADLKKEALDAFTQAHAIDRSNISALLNRASLVREGLRPELAEKIAVELNELAKAGGGSWTLASSHGYVVRPSDFFDAKWHWTLSGLPFTDQAKIESELSAIQDPELRTAVARNLTPSLGLQTAGAQPAMMMLAKLSDQGFTWETMLQFAEQQLAMGDRARALRLVERAAAQPGADAQAVAFVRAQVLVKSGRPADAVTALMAVKTPENAAEVLTRVASARAAGGDTAGLLDAVTALQAASTNAPAWMTPFAESLKAQIAGDVAKARTLAAQAIEQDADTDFAFRQMLLLDLIANDKAAAEQHADAALARFPLDDFANYVKATALADRRDFATAERRFQISLSQNPAWFVLNDYAALAAETRRFDLAENLARNALASGGEGFAAVWDSLGSALHGQGKEAEAYEAFKTAVTKPGGDDPRIQLHYAESSLTAGDTDAARKALTLVDQNSSRLSIPERERLGKLRQALAPDEK
ncbi:MAG: hypothetical protein ACOX9C_01550 [Kiritimatiellia bacterium]